MADNNVMNITADKLAFLKDRLAQSNLSYNIRYGHVLAGLPLQYLQDADLPGIKNGLPIDTATPDGFVIKTALLHKPGTVSA